MKSHLLDQISGIAYGFETPATGMPLDLLYPKQVHGVRVFECDNTLSPNSVEADGVFTSEFTKIGIQTADCMPVLFCSMDGRWVAAVHSGWKGTLDGVLLEAARALQDKGVSLQNTLAVFGPSIGPCCFEVDVTLADRFEKKWGHIFDVEKVCLKEPTQKSPYTAPPSTTGSHRWMGLFEVGKAQLLSVGFSSAHIENLNICTYCATDSDSKPLMASYRRATHQNTVLQSKRQWSWIQKIIA